MNLLTKQVYGNKAVVGFNTYIGGVSATISTAALLATKLGISVGRIYNFTVVGSDIKCNITGSYVIPNGAFTSNTDITYFTDSGICTSYDSRSFAGAENLVYIELPNVVSITITDNFIRNYNLERIYNPLCISYGATVGENGLFDASGFKQGARIYTHSSMATINAGGLEGDLADAATKGALIRYVANLTSPNVLTSANIGNIYNTSLQLLDNGSTNPIDYYDVYLNGTYYGKVLANDYIIGLTASTSYNITAYSVDTSGNISSLSGTVTQSTNTTSAPVPTAGLISYWKLNSNSTDSYGSNNGTDTSVSYVTGKIGNSGSYNGASSISDMGNPANLQISTGSVSVWIKTTGAGSSDRGIIGKNNAYMLFLRDNVLGLYSWGSPSGFKSTGMSLNDNLWHNIILVFESGTDKNYIYVDGVLKLTFSMSISNQTTSFKIGYGGFSTQYFNGLIDEASVYLTKLNATQRHFIYNSGNGITL